MACFIKFGVLTNDPNLNTSQKIIIINKYGVPYVRTDIVLSEWAYTPNIYNQYVAAGLKPILNFNWGRQNLGAIPFPTDMTDYANRATSVLNYLQSNSSYPEVIVTENEELNKNYHSGSLSLYRNMLLTLSPLVHARGLKITNGGISGTGLEAATFRYVKATHGQSIANAFGNNCMTPSQVNAANNPGLNAAIEAAIADIQYLMTAYVDAGLDYVNVHSYEPLNPNVVAADQTAFTPYVLQYIKEYIFFMTGLLTFSNEVGIRNNTQPTLVTSFINNFIALGYPFVLYFDGDSADGTGSKALHQTGTTNLLATGDNYKAVITSIASVKTSCILSNNLGTVCGSAAIDLFTSGELDIGKVLYTSALCGEQTGYNYVLVNGKIFLLNYTTGVIVSDTGKICGNGTSGLYILSNNNLTICNATPTQLYTNGAFAIGSILFTDVSLLVKATGFSYVENLADRHVYNLNSTTAVVGSDTDIICSGGLPGLYKISNNSSTICAASNVTLYTNVIFGVGSVLFVDINLAARATGYSFVVANNIIYNVNSSTATVTSVFNNCTQGVGELYKLGNDITSICDNVAGTYYTDGLFASAKTLYADIGLTTELAVTGYSYLVRVATSIVYNLNSVTGLIGTATTSICGAGIAALYKIGNNSNTVCGTDNVTLYTDISFAIGAKVFYDINLTQPVIGYFYIVNPENNYIYVLNIYIGQVATVTSKTCTPQVPVKDDFNVNVSVYLGDEFNCNCNCP